MYAVCANYGSRAVQNRAIKGLGFRRVFKSASQIHKSVPGRTNVSSAGTPNFVVGAYDLRSTTCCVARGRPWLAGEQLKAWQERASVGLGSCANAREEIGRVTWSRVLRELSVLE